MKNTGEAGNRGPDVRSDCHAEIEMTSSGGIILEIKSKVKTLFGKSIEKLARDILNYFDIKNARLTIEDAGALELVIAARMEAAIKKAMKTEKEYLLPVIKENTTASNKDDFRFSRLYLPGNSPKLMINAGIHNPNGIIRNYP